MTKRFSRILGVIMVLVVVIGGISGCNNSSKEDDKGSATNVTKTETKAETEAESETDDKSSSEKTDNVQVKTVKIKYDTWYPPQQIMDEILAIFHEQNPHIEVEASITEPAARSQKLPVQLASGEVFDLIGTGLGEELGTLSQFYKPISPLMDKYIGEGWEDRLNTKALEYAGSFTDGELYCIPIGQLGSPVVYYNGDIFDKYGLEEPETYEDLIAIVDTLKEKDSDILPIVFRGQLKHLHTLGLMGIYGQKFDIGKHLRDTRDFSDPRVAEAVEFWKELFDKDIISKDNLDVDNSKSGEIFYSGQAAMMINGTWMAGLLSEEYREKNGIEIEEIGAFIFPALEDGLTATLTVKPDISIAVGKDTENEEAVMKLYEFMLFGEGMEILAGNYIISPNDVSYEADSSKFTDERGLRGYNNIVQGMRYPQNPSRELDPILTEFGRILQSVIAEDTSIDEMLDYFQKEIDSGKYD